MRVPLRFALFASLLFGLCVTAFCASPPDPGPKIKRMIVLFDDEAAATNAARHVQVAHRFRYFHGFVCTVPESAADALRSLPGIRRVAEDSIVEACSQRIVTLETEPMNIRWTHREPGINAENAWNTHNVDGSGVKIAVLDSGVNYNLPDMVGYLGGASFCDPDGNPIDNGVLSYPEAAGDHTYDSSKKGHGTSVASIACSLGQDLDVELNRKATGISPSAGYFALKVLRSGRPGEYSPAPLYPQPGQGLTSWAYAAIDWCLALPPAERPDIINMSFGGYESDYAFDRICSEAYQAGIMLVAGSGNAGLGDPYFPAGYADVFAVGAHTLTQTVAGYSNGGVDLLAPAGRTTSDPEDWTTLWTVMRQVWRGTGTSLATPHASGMFALMIQYARNIYPGRQKQMLLNNGYFWEAATHSCHDLGLAPVWQGKGKADAKLALDLIANRWPINRSISGIGITDSTLSYSTTITNILSNSVPTPIGEQIANLSITATQAYYGENDELPLPGTTADTPIITAGSLDLPGTPGATQTIACSDSINTANLPNIARTELKFSFNFASEGRTMTITDPYALVWDPKFISPTINSATVSPAMVGEGDMIQVTVDASDNGAVAGVTANGMPLAHTTGTIWQGNVSIDPALGTHTVSIIAGDEAGLTATGTSNTYRTVPVAAMINRSAKHSIISDASANFLFSIWGRVSGADANGFTIDDGSQSPITVIAPGHSLVDNDYALARGTLDNSTTPAVLTSSAARCRKLD